MKILLTKAIYQGKNLFWVTVQGGHLPWQGRIGIKRVEDSVTLLPQAGTREEKCPFSLQKCRESSRWSFYALWAVFICVIKALSYEMLVIRVFLENQWLQPDSQSGLLKVQNVLATVPWVPFAAAICDLSCQSSDYISQHDLFHWPWQKKQLSKVLTNPSFFMLSSKFVSALIFISELFRLNLLFSGVLRHSLGHEIFTKKNFSNISQIWALSKGFHLCHFLDIFTLSLIFLWLQS